MMNFKKALTTLLIMFSVTLVVSAVVTYLWSFGFHETAKVDWESTFQLAIIVSVSMAVIDARLNKSNDN
jgi:flagellar basal body-associated protein FliL